MKILEKNRAIELRREGKTFTEIQRELAVSKGSLSYWLNGITLTPVQLDRIKYKNEKIREKFVIYNELRKKRAKASKTAINNNAFNEIDSLSARELKLIGIALYWAEGYTACACSTVDFVNTDPYMVKLMMRWFREVCCVEEKKFRIRIQLHNSSETLKAKGYWSEITGVPLTQFIKPYTKISPSSKKKTGNLLPYGICSIRISDVSLFSKIQGWIKGLMALSSSPA